MQFLKVKYVLKAKIKCKPSNFEAGSPLQINLKNKQTHIFQEQGNHYFHRSSLLFISSGISLYWQNAIPSELNVCIDSAPANYIPWAGCSACWNLYPAGMELTIPQGSLSALPLITPQNAAFQTLLHCAVPAGFTPRFPLRYEWSVTCLGGIRGNTEKIPS